MPVFEFGDEVTLGRLALRKVFTAINGKYNPNSVCFNKISLSVTEEISV